MRRLTLIGLLAAASTQAAIAPQHPGTKTAPPSVVNSNFRAESPRKSFWEDVGSRTDFSYFTQFNGPAIGRPLIEAHSTVGEGGPYPISLYHELNLEFHPTHDFSFGTFFCASQDLAGGVVNQYGNEVIPTFSLLQPSVFAKHRSIAETSWLRLAAQVSIMAPTSSYSIQERILGAVAFDQTWNIKLPDYRWQFYITTRLQPTFYQYALPLDYDGFQRETFFASAGYTLSYRFHPQWELMNSAIFDANHMSNDPGGVMSFGSTPPRHWASPYYRSDAMYAHDYIGGDS
jgi:hypothetical protein